jgi:hypothetical protein
MTKIVVDIEALWRMVDKLSLTAEDMGEWGKYLLRSTSDARSYDGQYAPWVQAMAGEADHDIRASADEVNQLGRELRRVTQAFEDAEQAESVGDFAWALIMREMVERGEIPRGDWFEWREKIRKPPWISPEVWDLLSPEEKRELVLEARKAYDAQNERIASMRTPPWEKDPNWLWNIIGIDPLLLDSRYLHGDINIAELQAYLEGVKREYDGHWADFLEKQAVFKFGVGDDLSEAFLIYMFGLEGAAEYGVQAEVSIDQRLMGVPDFKYSTGSARQYIDLSEIQGFDNAYNVVHLNLCGQLTIAVIIGEDPIDTLVQFENVSNGQSILEDPNMGTYPQNLIDLLEEHQWEGQPMGYASDPEPWQDYPPTMQNLHDYLVDGKVVIPLVNLNTNTGYLEPGDIHADASHWIAVLQTVETRTGEEFIRIYNPFQNREEWISYDDLSDAWELYAKSNRADEPMGPNYRAVIASPPEELAWLPNP